MGERVVHDWRLVCSCAAQSARKKESFIFASYCSVNPKHQSQSLEGN